jgi:hypothetical protein
MEAILQQLHDELNDAYREKAYREKEGDQQEDQNRKGNIL